MSWAWQVTEGAGRVSAELAAQDDLDGSVSAAEIEAKIVASAGVALEGPRTP